MSGTVIVSTLEGSTTEERGRFLISGPGYQLVSDGAVARGGPGAAAGPVDLLVAALLSAALDSLRGAGGPDEELVPGRRVRVYARAERDPDEERLGRVIVEAVVDGASDEEAAGLLADFTRRSRVYEALRGSLEIVFLVHGSRDLHSSRLESQS